MRKPKTDHYQTYKTDSGKTATMRIQLSNAVSAVDRAAKALGNIKDDGAKASAERRFNEGLDAIRRYYKS